MLIFNIVPSLAVKPINKTAIKLTSIEGLAKKKKKKKATHANLSLQVLHRLLKCLRWSSLMVTQDGHSPVGPVVGQDLGWNVLLRYREIRNTMSFCMNHDSSHTQMKSLLLIANKQRCMPFVQMHDMEFFPAEYLALSWQIPMNSN